MAVFGGFNGSTMTFGGTAYLLRNWSESGNARTQVDITSAADSRKVSLPGKAEPRTWSFECVYESATYATLQGYLDDTTPASLALSLGGSESVATVTASLIGLEFTGEMDDAVTFTAEFLIHEG
tara:strand:- start:24 stop:395 length:372 start_codon:yes stop_codon:yes gene_type:complete